MNLTYRVAQCISYGYFKLFHGFKIQGLENIPTDKPFILACNHLSFLIRLPLVVKFKKLTLFCQGQPI